MKRTQRIFVGVLILSTAYSSLAWAETWKTKRITNNPGFSGSPSIAASGSNVYITWNDYVTGNSEIYFRMSTNGGVKWLSEQMLTYGPNISCDPVIAVADSNIYIAWASGTGCDDYQIYFICSMDGGVTWLPAQRLSNTPHDSLYPSIAASGSNVYVAWGSLKLDGDIFFMRSLDGGTTWKAPKRLTSNSVEDNNPSIAVSSSNVYVVWIWDDLFSNQELHFRKSKTEGATWKSSQKLAQKLKPNSIYRPHLAASDSNVYVTWNYSDLGGIYFMKSNDEGTTWQPIKKLTNTTESYYHSIANNGSNVYVTWEDGPFDWPGKDIYFKKSKDEGATWKPTQRLTNNAKRDRSPCIAASDKKIYVVWSQEVGEPYGGDWDIYLKWAKVGK